ncbi:MAG: asparagine synthase (glutamine-hydrolyzing), partial [Gemmatimonadaceae bacterium]
MCGFVAYLAFQTSDAPSERWIRSLLHTLAHRGPDDDGIQIRDGVALGFRRLSILDLTAAGHQPMTVDDGAIALVFNGEIYNYVELRRELQSFGHTFRSSGDAEVLLRAYHQWGRKCLQHLVGMFSFCIADHRANTLFLARDRFGIKPLYFARNERGILFASEIKAIRRSGMWSGEINSGRFAQFLAYGRTEFVPDDSDTYLHGVHQLLAGQSCVVRFDGRMTFEQYWSTAFDPTDSDENPVPAFREAFDTSVRQHMRADVPVGVMLSGGMDSVSIACTMERAGGQPSGAALHAFSYVSPDADESVQLRDTLHCTGATSHLLNELDAHTFWSTLHQLVWYNDEPVHSPSALMGFELYRLAAKSGVRVVLSGQGADESLGGYQQLFDNMLVTTALRGELPTLSRQIGYVAATTGRTRASTSKRLAKMLRSHAFSHLEWYRNQSAIRQFGATPGPAYLDENFMSTALPVVESVVGQRLSDALQRAM